MFEKDRGELVLSAIKDAVQALEQIASTKVNATQTGIGMKLLAQDALVRVVSKLYDAGIRLGGR